MACFMASAMMIGCWALAMAEFISTASQPISMAMVAPDELMPAAMRLANVIADNGPLSVKITKELGWRGLHEHPHEFMRFVAAALALVHGSEDAKEGPAAFAEKRKPVWRDR